MHKISLQARDDLSKPLFLERNICNNCTCIKCTWSMYCRAIAKSLYKPTSCFLHFKSTLFAFLSYEPLFSCLTDWFDKTSQRNTLQVSVFLKEIVKPYLCCLVQSSITFMSKNVPESMFPDSAFWFLAVPANDVTVLQRLKLHKPFSEMFTAGWEI